MEIAFTVEGLPQTAGSKRAFALKRRDGSLVKRPNGSPVINVTDDNPKSHGWKNDVAGAARAQVGRDFGLIDGPIVLSLCFYLPRPKSHFGSGRNSSILKPASPVQHLQKPDVLKLARAVEDALTGVVWRDDCLIVNEVIGKAWGEPARVEIQIVSVDDSTIVTELRRRAATKELFPAEAST